MSFGAGLSNKPTYRQIRNIALQEYKMEVESQRGKKRRLEAGFTYTKKGKAMPYSQKQAVRKVIREDMETKYFDRQLTYTLAAAHNAGGGVFNWSTSNISTTGLFYPPEGLKNNDRVGQKVTIHKIMIRGQYRAPEQGDFLTTDSDDPAINRLVIAFNRDNVGKAASCTGDEVIQDMASVNLALLGFQDIDNMTQNRVIYDKTHILQNPNMVTRGLAGTDAIQQGLATHFKKIIKFKKPVEVQFYREVSASDSSIILHNALQGYAITSNIDLVPTLDLNVRCYYKELNH